MSGTAQPHFIAAADGSTRFVLHHVPPSAPRALVVHVHPFAEEMNKSRRMAALQSRALARAGFAVVQIDLLGCGDSSGELAEASWDAWLADVALAVRWLRQQHGEPAATMPLWLWGHRAGCLLATQAAARLEGPCDFLFWQPPASGKPLLQQFLRLKMAADLHGGKGAGVIEALRTQLAAGHAVEVAGYVLPAAMAQGLEEAQLRPPAYPGRTGRTGQMGHCVWLETSLREPAAVLPASQAPLAAWREAGFDVQAGAVPGPAFWQTQEIEDAPALIAETVKLLAAAVQAAVPA